MSTPSENQGDTLNSLDRCQKELEFGILSKPLPQFLAGSAYGCNETVFQSLHVWVGSAFGRCRIPIVTRPGRRLVVSAIAGSNCAAMLRAARECPMLVRMALCCLDRHPVGNRPFPSNRNPQRQGATPTSSGPRRPVPRGSGSPSRDFRLTGPPQAPVGDAVRTRTRHTRGSPVIVASRNNCVRSPVRPVTTHVFRSPRQ